MRKFLSAFFCVLLLCTLAATGFACTDNKVYKVTFDSKGGTGVAAIENVKSGDLIAEPDAPTKDGYDFKGWYSDEANLYKWDFASQKVESDLTLYAKWEPKSKTDESKTATEKAYEVIDKAFNDCVYYENEMLDGTIYWSREGIVRNYIISGIKVTYATADTVFEVNKRIKYTKNEYSSYNYYELENYLDGIKNPEYAAFGFNGTDKDTIICEISNGQVMTFKIINNTLIEIADDYQTIKLFYKSSDGKYTLPADADTYQRLFWVSYEYNTGLSEHRNKYKLSESGIIEFPTDCYNGDFEFGGWYTDANFSGSPVAEGSELTSDVTLYAKWRQKSEDRTRLVNAIVASGEMLSYSVVIDGDVANVRDGSFVSAYSIIREAQEIKTWVFFDGLKGKMYRLSEGGAFITEIQISDGQFTLSGLLGQYPFLKPFYGEATSPYYVLDTVTRVTTGADPDAEYYEATYTDPKIEGKYVFAVKDGRLAAVRQEYDYGTGTDIEISGFEDRLPDLPEGITWTGVS